MNNKRRIIGIVAATVLALIGTISLIGYVNSAKEDAVADEALVDIYVVDEFVPEGADPETIKSSVVLERVPARLEQDGAITDLDDVGDLVAAIDLQPGDQLLAARLAPRDPVSEVATDKVQISALLEAERAVGGAIRKGDLVGVYLSFDPFTYDEAGEEDETESADNRSAAATPDDAPEDPDANDEDSDDRTTRKTPNVSHLEFQHVLVTNVQTISAPVSTDDEDEDDGPDIEQVTGTQYVVTLALSPEESERFVFATEFGHVWLSIEAAGVTDDGTRPVTLGNVYSVVGP